jgi:hypothetical protein
MTPQSEQAIVVALQQIASNLQRINVTLSNIQASQSAIASNSKSEKF